LPSFRLFSMELFMCVVFDHINNVATNFINVFYGASPSFPASSVRFYATTHKLLRSRHAVSALSEMREFPETGAANAPRSVLTAPAAPAPRPYRGQGAPTGRREPYRRA